jgi:hypothetical protein
VIYPTDRKAVAIADPQPVTVTRPNRLCTQPSPSARQSHPFTLGQQQTHTPPPRVHFGGNHLLLVIPSDGEKSLRKWSDVGIRDDNFVHVEGPSSIRTAAHDYVAKLHVEPGSVTAEISG